MKTTAVIALALFGSVAAVADIRGEAVTATGAATVAHDKTGWIARAGLDRQKTLRLMLDYVCVYHRGAGAAAREAWARKFLDVARENADDLKTPTIPHTFTPSEAHDAYVVAGEKDGKAERHRFAWNGKSAHCRTFTSATLPDSIITFASDYEIANARLIVAEGQGVDVYKPEATEGGRCWRFRSLANPDKCYLVWRQITGRVPCGRVEVVK